MVPTGSDFLANAHATTKMHLEMRNFWNAGDEHVFYEFLHVLPSQIYKHLRIDFEMWMVFFIPFTTVIYNNSGTYFCCHQGHRKRHFVLKRVLTLIPIIFLNSLKISHYL